MEYRQSGDPQHAVNRPALPAGWQPFSTRQALSERVLLAVWNPSRGWRAVHSVIAVPAGQQTLPEALLCGRMFSAGGDPAVDGRTERVGGAAFLRYDTPPSMPGQPYRLRCARRVDAGLESFLFLGASQSDCLEALRALEGALRLLPKTVGSYGQPVKRVQPVPVQRQAVIPDRDVPARRMEGASALPAVPKRKKRTGTVLLTMLLVLAVLGAGAFFAVRYLQKSDLTELSDQTALCAYLNEQYAAGETEVAFRYTGKDLSQINNSLFYDMTNALAVRTRISTDRPDCFYVTLTPYPGDRMLQAYRTSDESGLSADEKKALAKAKTLLAAAKESSGNRMELELALHDALCERVTYYTSEARGDYETAVGALLNGKANCQGYSDAFFLLASMAGFEVGRQSADSLGSDDIPGGPHRFNTIRLDGKWYIVDVTFDDPIRKDGKYHPCYQLFNAGKDVGKAYYKNWDRATEAHPIERKSGTWYYYNYVPGDGSALDYQKRFSSLDALTASAAKEFQTNGRRTQHLRLDGDVVDGERFKNAMKAYNLSWQATWFDDDHNTYFCIEFQ